ncbi:MAG: nuclear transport factor 2 family protein [Steroidobacteraceae bacterium]
MGRLTRTLVLAVLAAGCVQSPAPEPFPQEVADAWVERYAAHDAAGVAALYTADAQLLPPDMEIISGRAAIQEFVARTNPPGSAPLEMATTETLVFGDFAHRQGSFAIKGPDGAAPETGKFIELLKKVDGRWLIYRDIWNWNAAPPALPAPDAPTDESA